MGAQEADELNIGEYKPGDLGEIHALDAICFSSDIAFSRDELLCYVSHPNSITRIARLNGGVVGFIIGKIERKYLLHILTLDVVPGLRRRKIGTALMDSLHQEGLRNGAKVSILEVDVRNAAARRFYEQLRYDYDGILPGYYSGCRDAYRMIRILKHHMPGK